MQIAYVTANFPPYLAGVGNACYHSAIELAKLGHDVTVFTSNFPKGRFGYPEIFKVRRLDYIFVWGKSFFLPGLLKIKGFDIVHLHHPFYFGSEMIYFSSKLREFDYILTYHMDVPLRRFGKLLKTPLRIHDRFVNRRIISNASKIIVTSMDYAQHSRMKDIFAEKGKDVIEIPLGFDFNSFCPRKKNADILEKYSIGNDEKIILFVGALDRQHYSRGVDYLLKAFSRIDHDNARLLVVGDGELKDFYIALARKLGVYGKTVFTGAANFPNVAAYYDSADLLVLPSVEVESFGLVVLEAMASGKPVITSDLPGVRTLVDNEHSGLLVEPGNIEDLASKIEYLLDNDELRELFGARGRKMAVEKYSWEKIALRLNEVYLRVVDESTK